MDGVIAGGMCGVKVGVFPLFHQKRDIESPGDKRWERVSDRSTKSGGVWERSGRYLQEYRWMEVGWLEAVRVMISTVIQGGVGDE
jgi:hypothetical protein